MNELRTVILRGLSMSCISVCTLRDWWERLRIGYDGWYTEDFEDKLWEMEEDGLVYIQRQVPCRVCGRSREEGWALTDAGNTQERKIFGGNTSEG